MASIESQSVRPPSSAPGGGRNQSLASLRGLVLLAGGVGRSELRGIDRSVLDLPVEHDATILGLWSREAEALAEALGAGPIPVRVLVDADGDAPNPSGNGAAVSIERDRSEYRGSGGALRDACEAYADDDVVLMASAHQVLLEPLTRLVAHLTRTPADVSILAGDQGLPAALIAVRVAATRGIRAVGFVDFKEQALPELARRFDVRVVRRPGADAMPVRTLDDYIDAVRAHHRRAAGRAPFEGPFGENWRATFGLVEAGAEAPPDVRVHDSVVLRGARVGPRAVLVRSLVCGGAEVKAGEVVTDRIVGARANRAAPQGRTA